MADPLAALDTAGIRYSVRKGSTTFDGLAAGGELDVELDAGDVGGADRALSRVGFHHLVAPGTEPHRFYLSFERGRWLKVDAKVTGDVRRAERVTKLRRRLPASKRRRLGPVIAFLGPDGAGKGTVIEALRRSILGALQGEHAYSRRILSALIRNGHWLRASNALPLTPRQREVIMLIARGAADKEIARSLGITTATAQKHVTNLLRRLNVPNRAAAVATMSAAYPL